jgi:hypothetical protein
MEYDYGCGREFDIALTKIHTTEETIFYPSVVAGE